jgi:hypothetical protein
MGGDSRREKFRREKRLLLLNGVHLQRSLYLFYQEQLIYTIDLPPTELRLPFRIAILQGGARKGAAGLELGSGQRILAAGGGKKVCVGRDKNSSLSRPSGRTSFYEPNSTRVSAKSKL